MKSKENKVSKQEKTVENLKKDNVKTEKVKGGGIKVDLNQAGEKYGGPSTSTGG
ncbi:MAG: hypothetical protein N4A46_10800 [Schleiferiaceae bacterium]|jgi:hypothetical protein|nr:hypothetical protein [Schleiferiaceae bacterium]